MANKVLTTGGTGSRTYTVIIHIIIHISAKVLGDCIFYCFGNYYINPQEILIKYEVFSDHNYVTLSE